MKSVLHPENTKVMVIIFVVLLVVCAVLQYCGIIQTGNPGDNIQADTTTTAKCYK